MKDDQLVTYCPPPLLSETPAGTWRPDLQRYLAPGVPASHATIYPTTFTHVGGGEYAARAWPAAMAMQYRTGMNPQYDLWLANAMVALTEEELNARHLQLAAGMQNAGAVSFGISPYWPPVRATLRERIASAWREWLETVDYWPAA
jgi:hypothetical protein